MVRHINPLDLAEIPPYNGNKTRSSVPSTIGDQTSNVIVPHSQSLVDVDTQRVIAEVWGQVENNLEQFGDQVNEKVQHIPTYLQQYGDIIQTSSSQLFTNAADAFEQFSNPKLGSQREGRQEAPIRAQRKLGEQNQRYRVTSTENRDFNDTSVINRKERNVINVIDRTDNNAIEVIDRRDYIPIDVIDRVFHTVESEVCSYEPESVHKSSILNRQGGVIDQVFQNLEATFCEAHGELPLLACPSAHPYQPTSIRTKTFPSPFSRMGRRGKKKVIEAGSTNGNDKEVRETRKAHEDGSAYGRGQLEEKANKNDETILSRDFVDQELKDTYSKISTRSKSPASDGSVLRSAKVFSVPKNMVNNVIPADRKDSKTTVANYDVRSNPAGVRNIHSFDYHQKDNHKISKSTSLDVKMGTGNRFGLVEDEIETFRSRKLQETATKQIPTRRESPRPQFTHKNTTNKLPVKNSGRDHGIVHKNYGQHRQSDGGMSPVNSPGDRDAVEESRIIRKALPEWKVSSVMDDSILSSNVDDESEASSHKRKITKNSGDGNSVSKWIGRMSPMTWSSNGDHSKKSSKSKAEIPEISTVDSWSTKSSRQRDRRTEQPKKDEEAESLHEHPPLDEMSQSCGSNQVAESMCDIQRRLKDENPYEQVRTDEAAIEEQPNNDISGFDDDNTEDRNESNDHDSYHDTRSCSKSVSSLGRLHKFNGPAGYDKYYIPDNANLVRNRSLLDDTSLSTNTPSRQVRGASGSKYSFGYGDMHRASKSRTDDSVGTGNESSMVVNLNDEEASQSKLSGEKPKKKRMGIKLLKSFGFNQRKKK